MPSGRRSKKRPYGGDHVPLREELIASIPVTERGPGGHSYTVRRLAGNNERSYVCPGCLQTIAPFTAHVVVWSNDHLYGAAAGLEERRHWHSACWDRGKHRNY